MSPKSAEQVEQIRLWHRNRYARLTTEERKQRIDKATNSRKRRCEQANQENGHARDLKLSKLHELRKVSNCRFCNAVKLQHEPPSFCCDKGKVVLSSPRVAESLYTLFTSEKDEALEFQYLIRAYDSIFTFTSFGVDFDKDLATSKKGVYTFRVHGQIYHNLPSLIPYRATPCYFQLYFYDTNNEVRNRLNILRDADLSESTVAKLMEIMSRNPYAQFFRILEHKELDTLMIRLRTDVKLDKRVYNTPTVDQVSAIWIVEVQPHYRFRRAQPLPLV